MSYDISSPLQFTSLSMTISRCIHVAVNGIISFFLMTRQFSSVQSLSRVWLFATPWTSAHQAFLSVTNSPSLLKLMSIKVVMPSNHLILVPFSSHFQSFPSSESFQMSQFFTSGGQSIGVLASASVVPLNIQDWFPLRLTGLISLQSKRLLQIHSAKLSNFRHSAFFIVQLSHPYMTTWKTIALTRWTFVGKIMSLLFNMLSRLVIDFLPRNKHLLISWLQLSSAVILEPPKIKSLTVSIVSPSVFHEVMGLDAMILVFWMLNFKPNFSLSSFTFIQRPGFHQDFSSSIFIKTFIKLAGNIPLYMCTTSSLSFFCQWTLRLLLGYYKQCCRGHWDACILSDHVFIWIYAQEWDSWTIW